MTQHKVVRERREQISKLLAKSITKPEQIEQELQVMRQKETDPDKKLKIMRLLAEIIGQRWQIQGDGPTLMQMYSLQKNENP